jgi:PAS domain S-box-containing protein
MSKKPTYEELEQQIKVLEKSASECKRTEKLLRNSTARHSVMMDNIGDVIGVLGDDGAIKYQSPNVEKWFGWKPEEIIGTISFEKVHPEDVKRIQKKFSKILKNESPLVVEFRHKCKDGTYKWIELTAANHLHDPAINGVLVNYHDVSARKQAEKALLESNIRYQQVAERSGEWIWKIDVDGIYKYVSPSVLSLLGYRSDEIIGKKHFYDFFAPDIREESRNIVFAAFAQNKPLLDFENPNLHKDGRIIILETSVFPILDENNNLLGYRGVDKDITQQKRVEEALLSNQYYLTKAQEIGSIGTWELDLQNDELIWTDQSYLNFGVPIGTPLTYEVFLECIHPDDRDYVNAEWKKAIDGKPYDIEHRILVGDEVKWLREKAELEFDAKGKPIKAIGFTQDITERKQAAEALKESEERFDLAMGATQDGVFDWNLVTNESYYSPRWKSMLGYEYDEIPNDLSVWEKLIEEEDAKKSWKMQREVINKKRDRFEMEFKMKHKDGHWVYILSRAEVVFDENGKAVRMIGTHLDITERKQAEVELIEAKEKAEESEAKFKQLSNLTFEGIVLHQKGIAIDCNLSFAKSFGYTREEIIGKDLGKLVIKEEYRDIVLQNIIKNYAFPYEVVGLRKDGTEIPLEIEARNVRSDDKTIRVSAVRDISERKKGEVLLRNSEIRFRMIYENAPILIDGFDENGRCVLWNNSCEQTFGWSMEEINSHSDPFSLFYPDPEIRQQVIDSITLNPDNKFREFFPHTKAGNVLTCEWANYQLTDGTVMSVGHDITERKKTEKVLIESEDRFRKMIDNMPSGVAIYKAVDNANDFEFIELNKKAEEFTKTSKEEVIGHTLLEKFPNMKDGQLVKSLKKISKDGINIYIPPFFYKDEQRQGWRENNIYKLASGEIVAIFKDVTDLKEAEIALTESLDLLHSVIEHIPMRVFWKDIELRYLGCNSAFAHDAGMLKADDLLGKDDVQVAGRELAEIYRTDDKLVMDSDKPRIGLEESKTTPGGYEMWTSTSKVPLHDAQGKVIGLLGIYDDITERKLAEKEHGKLQDQLRQAQKMESVGRLAGGVAHDYNNISSIIMGYSELALDEVAQSDPLYGYLSEILTATKRSADITRQLLAFARKQTIVPKVLNLNTTIGDLLKMLHRLIGEDINLAWIPGTEIRPIKIDPTQINQIMANLCVNARDAIANVGRVTVETKNINFDEDYCTDHEGAIPGEYIELSVSDDGCGMTPETCDKIFEPFFTTKDVGKGTGLGLSTVYGIVKQNNGFVNVYSKIEKGTTFRIYLPVHVDLEQTVKVDSDKIIELPLSRGETVLLVEDDESILKIITRVLENIGYAVLSSSSPVEAMKLAAKHADEINLLITDVVMPEMNGRELAESLQSLYPHLKILFMSGYTADIIAKRGVLESGVSFIEKPFSNQELAVKVREVLDGEKKG